MRKAIDGVMAGVFVSVLVREVFARWFPTLVDRLEARALRLMESVVRELVDADAALELNPKV